MASPFDERIDRRNTYCNKWDGMDRLYGVSPDDGLAMWVADTDFRVAPCIQEAARQFVDHGIYGYAGDVERIGGPYREAICWWMAERHGWEFDQAAIFTVTGLCNGISVCLDAFTQPGDGVVTFNPVYHAFARVIEAAGRRVVPCEMPIEDGRYRLDFAAWDAQMTGTERMLILCSPHNPGGRVWTEEELQGVAEFAKRHDLLILSDEIHHDLIYPGHKHIPMACIPGVEDRLVMLTAPSKTFNTAGLHVGNVIIPDTALREAFAKRMGSLAISPGSLGLFTTAAAYSPEGAAWVDDLMLYLDGNRQLFDAGIARIPGLASMPLESTFLAWVDSSGTGMSAEEFTRRVQQDAKIAANHGHTFGVGGDSFLRFNLGAPRAVIADAVERLQRAFADLQ